MQWNEGRELLAHRKRGEGVKSLCRARTGGVYTEDSDTRAAGVKWRLPPLEACTAPVREDIPNGLREAPVADSAPQHGYVFLQEIRFYISTMTPNKSLSLQSVSSSLKLEHQYLQHCLIIAVVLTNV